VEDLLIALTTVPDRASAERLTNALLAERKAACVNVLSGVSSFYRWHGKVETAEELLLIIKLRAEHFDAVSEIVKREHPYEVPELVAFRAEKVAESYLRWALEQTSD